MNFLRKIPDIMFILGFFILIGTAGTSDIQPDYPFRQLVIQGIFGMLLMLPMVVRERWWQDEQD
jgi:hypothetical protein